MGDNVNLQQEWCIKRAYDGSIKYETDDCLERFYKKVLVDYYSNPKQVTLPLLISIPKQNLPSTCMVVKKYEDGTEVVLWLILLRITPTQLQPQVIATSKKVVDLQKQMELKNTYSKKISGEIEKMRKSKLDNPFNEQKMGMLNMKNQRTFLNNSTSHSVLGHHNYEILDLPKA